MDAVFVDSDGNVVDTHASKGKTRFNIAAHIRAAERAQLDALRRDSLRGGATKRVAKKEEKIIA